MKTVLLIAALMAGTAAVAQETTTTTNTTTTADPGMAAPAPETPPINSMPSDAAAPPADATMATPPTAATDSGMSGSTTSTSTSTSTETYPVCTRAITDRCVNPSASTRTTTHRRTTRR